LIQFKVEADKGFTYSTIDDAFICQKKNHFQITTHTTLKNPAKYFKLKNYIHFHEIEYYQLQFYGVKQESQMQYVPIKQSNSNRKPIDYEPEKFQFYPFQQNKLTVKRLHFAHTTNNNNRKKNKPNPEQRYFLLIVDMQVLSKSTGQLFTLYAVQSEKIIVRVSFTNI
jgi:myelin regulatory factor